MPYPQHLLPQPGFRIMPPEVFLSYGDLVLCRHQDCKVSVLPSSGMIDPNSIKLQSSHFHDLSNNLVGVFTLEDIYWELTKIEGKAHPLYDDWDGKECCSLPKDEDCIFRGERGCYWFKVSSIAGKSFPDVAIKRDGKGRIVKQGCFHVWIGHTPKRCNYWHVSLRVLDEKDVNVDSLALDKKEKRNIWTVVKNFLMDNLSIGALGDNFFVLPESVYKT